MIFSWRWADGDAPGVAADFDGFDRLEGRDVDGGDVVGDAVGGEEDVVFGRQGQVPNALTDEDVFFHLG